MGKVVEKKRKKKGRPSLLDLQKRSLKLHQDKLQNQEFDKIQNPNPQPPSDYSSTPAAPRRSTRRYPDPTTEDENDSAGKKREKKKIKLAHKLPDGEGELRSEEKNNGSDSDSDDDHSSRSNPRKRKVGSIARRSGLHSDDKDEKLGASKIETSNQQGSKHDDGPSTPLPDQKLLLFILDRLQKKDTYRVFADPVDPEELPDYHELIENPMDFSTLRKKLANGSYAYLEQFEKDVFLVCSNAMQYNSPDTIYFRQARSIQELAKKDFENLRLDSDDNESQPEPKVVRRGRPPTKNLKRPPGRPPLERANSDFSEATPSTTVANNNRSNIVDTRRGTSLLEKCGSAELFAHSFYGSRHAETYIGWSAERYEKTDDITGSASKGIFMKHGKKQIVLDENRRNTYKQSFAFAYGQEPSVLTTFNEERKQLIAVGLHMEYGYARSLARFAANLGPMAWKVASKKIYRCLPAGVKFGPGWVGENEDPMDGPIPHQLPAASCQPSKSSSSLQGVPSSSPTQRTVELSCEKSMQNPQREPEFETCTSSMEPKSDDLLKSSKTLSSSAAGKDTTRVSSSLIIPSNDAKPRANTPYTSASFNPNTSFNMSNSITGAMRAVDSFHNHQASNIPSRINRLNGSYGLSFAAQMGKMIGAARPNVVNLQSNPSIVTVSRAETQNLHPPPAVNNCSGEAKLPLNFSAVKPSDSTVSHQKAAPTQQHLNVGFQSPGSQHSGKAVSVQPDLALQL